MRFWTPDRRDAHLVDSTRSACRAGARSPRSRAHRIGHPVGVEDRRAVDVPRRAADRLDQRALGAQEALLVRIQDRHQRDLGNVEPLAQQVDADQHVELPEPQVADDLDPLDRVDVGMQVAHLDAVLVEVVGEVLGHPLGQRRHQHALALRDAQRDLRRADRRPASAPDARRAPGRPARSAARPARPPAPRASARTRPASPRRRSSARISRSNSSNRSGRLSSADGSRKP